MRAEAHEALDDTLDGFVGIQPAFLPGDVVDRYEILEHVADGGMGSVWRARYVGCSGFEKHVAIKAMLPGFAWHPRSHRMFLDEVRLVSRLSHPNVAQVLDFGERDGFLYVVFEWIEGTTLSRWRQDLRRPGGLEILLRLLLDVCGALHAAHELRDEAGEPLQVIHRDVTPANILVSRYGFAKLIDFGIARARARVTEDTTKGSVRGTPGYMAPEHAVGGIVDRRADVWSVGAVLHRAIVGDPPFNNVVQLIDYASGARPLPLLPPHVPAIVRGVVERALQPWPEDRFQTAREMRCALEEAIVTLRLGYG